MIHTVDKQTKSTAAAAPEARWCRRDWWQLSLLGVLALLLFLPGLGAFGVIDPSEAYYSETAREMLARNEWVTPFLNYAPWYEKPVLTYWLIELSYKIFTVSEFAARLPSALLAGSFVPAFYAFCRCFLRRRAAFLSALILLTSPLYLVVGHLSLTDMPFSIFLATALLSFFQLLYRSSASFFWLGYICLGLAVLTKGPLALFISALVLAAFLLVGRSTWQERRLSLRQLKPFAGLLVACLVALPWYIAVCVKTNGAFAQEFFIKQNLARAAGTADHKFPPWFYVPYLLGGAAPWSIGLFALPKVLLRFFSGDQKHSRQTGFLKFCAIWAALVFLVLSLIPSKLPTYILPVWPALAVLLGTAFDTTLRLHKAAALRWTGPVLAALLTAALAFVPALLSRSTNLLAAFIAGALVVTAGMIVYTIALWRKFPRLGLRALASGVTIGSAVLIPLSLQAFFDYHQRGFRQILETASHSRANIALAGPVQPSTFFYLRRHIPLIVSKEDLESFLHTTNGQHWIITRSGHIAELLATGWTMTVIEHHRSWFLISLQSPSSP